MNRVDCATIVIVGTSADGSRVCGYRLSIRKNGQLLDAGPIDARFRICVAILTLVIEPTPASGKWSDLHRYKGKIGGGNSEAELEGEPESRKCEIFNDGGDSVKNSWEWTENDILEMIENEVPESLFLDYKANGSLVKHDQKKKAEISKDVSAFANSAGGTIVYGVAEDEDKLKPVKIDEGFDPADITKEWLEQVINSNIQRRIDGIRITQISLAETNPGRVIYVVHIPQSTSAPHMASDKRFYKRFNFESVPMEEYEIRDVANRISSPDLHLKFLFGGAVPETPSFVKISSLPESTHTQPTFLDVAITNYSATPAEYIIYNLYFDNRIVINTAPSYFSQQSDFVIEGNKAIPINRFSRNHAINGLMMPVWKNVVLSITSPQFSLSFPKLPGPFYIGYQLQSPRMEDKRVFYTIFMEGEMLRILPGIVESPVI